MPPIGRDVRAISRTSRNPARLPDPLHLHVGSLQCHGSVQSGPMRTSEAGDANPTVGTAIEKHCHHAHPTVLLLWKQ